LFGLALAALVFTAAVPATADAMAGAPAVLLTGGDRFGSGIVWSASEGLVVTALHVVERMTEIRIGLGDGRTLPARVVDQDPALDLALLRAEGALGRIASADPRPPPARDETVWLLGYPDLRATAAEATVLEPDRRFAGSRYLEVKGRARPGASGGPVVDARGAVVGIVDVVLPGRGVTLAIPIAAALARFPLPPAGPAGEQPLARAGEAVPGTPRAGSRQD
jgi:S1-C subfamily serine protease